HDSHRSLLQMTTEDRSIHVSTHAGVTRTTPTLRFGDRGARVSAASTIEEEGNMLGVMASVLAAAGDKGSDIDIGSIIGFVIVGAIVGVLARFLVPGDDPMGIIG